MQMTENGSKRAKGSNAGPVSCASCVPSAPYLAPRPFDPARNASMDSPPCNSIKTKDRGRTSPELYSGPFDPLCASTSRVSVTISNRHSRD